MFFSGGRGVTHPGFNFQCKCGASFRGAAFFLVYLSYYLKALQNRISHPVPKAFGTGSPNLIQGEEMLREAALQAD